MGGGSKEVSGKAAKKSLQPTRAHDEDGDPYLACHREVESKVECQKT